MKTNKITDVDYIPSPSISSDNKSLVTQESLKKSNEILNRYIVITAGTGFIPVPFLDSFAAAAFMVKMLRKIATVYEIEYKPKQVKKHIVSLGGLVILDSVADWVIKVTLGFIPVVGQFAGGASMAISSGGTTYAVGKIFITHFERGGTFEDFNPKAVKDCFNGLLNQGKDHMMKLKSNKNLKVELTQQEITEIKGTGIRRDSLINEQE